MKKSGEYALAGKKFVCSHCGSTEWEMGHAQLNTAGMTFFNLDWANRSATTLVCTECGRIEWCYHPPTRL